MQQKEDFRGGAGYVALIAALILFYRFPDRVLNGFLWAEDGLRFLPDAYKFGFRALFSEYQGYLHTLPRLIAYLAARTTPAPLLPFVLPAVCLVVTSLGAAVTYRAALRLPWRSCAPAWATLVALSPLLVPHSGEVFLTITNLQWLTAPTLLALLYRAPSLHGRRAFGVGVATGILATTGPFSVFMLPLVAAVVAFRFRRPSRATALIFATYFIGALIQGWVLMVHAGDPSPPGALVGVLDLAMRDLIGTAFLPRALLANFEIAPKIATSILALAFAWMIWKIPMRFELVAMLALGLMVWAAGMAKTGSGARLWWDGPAARYTYQVYVYFAWALLIGAGLTVSMIARGALLVPVIAMLLISGTMLVPTPLTPTTVTELPNGGYSVHLPPGWTGVLLSGKLRVRND